MTKRQVAQHKPGTAMRIGGPLSRTMPRAQGGLAGLLAGVSVSAAALALAAIPQQARAQSAVNATVAGTTNATVSQGTILNGRTVDQVSVSGSQATVDWALDPTGVSSGVFLNGGTTLDFQGSGSYTVLNRVNPMTLTGTLALNGSVTSSVGGKIWFYNPGGWVVGSGASIDVGSLVLTSSPIATTAFDPDNPNATGLYGPGGVVRFGQANAGSSVTVASGASIRADQNNSYVALVAPRVVQAGTVSTNGTTAYVAAGAADIKIDNGLFDIVVTSGTDDPNGVVHTGSTSRFEPNSSSAALQGIYLVAVPKNDALTMLVSGNLGYNSASSAAQVGGKIVLSAGYDLAGGQVVGGPSTRNGSITLRSLSLGGPTQADARDTIRVSADSNNAVFASDNLSLDAGKRIDVVAFGEGGLFVNGSLALDARIGKTGGIIDVSVDGGAMFRVGGTFDAHVDGIGGIQSDGDVLLAGAAGEAATGGSVKIALGDARYAVGGQTSLSANATGGLGGASAGSARAGSVSFSSTAASTLSQNSALNLQVSADATFQQFGAGPTTGASATGGTVDLAFGGSFTANSISVSALANANPGRDGAAQNATGGSVSLAFSGAGSIVTVSGIDLTATAFAGNAGIASGAAMTFKVDGATLNAPFSSIICEGFCFQPSSRISIENSRSGNGPAAGSIGFSVVNGGTLDLTASPFGSIGLFSDASAGPGGTATGATIVVTVDGGTVKIPSFVIESDGRGNSGGPQSNGRGGDISVTLRNGGRIDASSGFLLSSTGSGGNGTAAGDGTGGNVLVSIGNGSLTSPTVNVGSFGFAGDQLAGGTRIGTGTGGSAAIRLTDTAAILSAGFVSVDAPGQAARSEVAAAAVGPIAISGAGGSNGQGGTASVTVDAGSLTANTSLTVDASGEGGDGFGGGAGGTGTGGTASFTVNGGNASPATLRVSADGRGGSGADYDSESDTPAGNGGAGTGGSASLSQSNGFLNTGSIALSATGNAPRKFSSNGSGGAVSGNGPATGGAGGLGMGGTTSIVMTGGSLANLSGTPVSSISLDSRGVGGKGGDAFSNSSSSQLTRGSGGSGRGGTSEFTLSAGSADFTTVSLDASGSGGFGGQEFGVFTEIPSNGGNGGAGFGGGASITLGTAVAATDSFDSTRSYSALVGGFGADGGDGAIGGTGGAGQGGSAQLRVTAPDVFVDQFDLDAYSYGGDGGSSGLANNGGAGGKGTGGMAQLVVAGSGVNFTPVNGLLDVSGEGGFGGTGGSGQVRSLDAAGNGGTAGAGFGGAIQFSASNGATLDLAQTTDLQLYTYGSGGSGGDGGNAEFNAGTAIGNGGNGGDGTGGAIDVIASDGTVLLGSFSVTADGLGGTGGGRRNADGVSTDASNGGNGGNGFGGNVTLTASGPAGSIQAASLDISVNGSGGSGVDGQGYDPVTFVGASGGAGAAGTGGTIRLDALDRSAIAIATDSTSTLNAKGFAAFGGVGANGATNPATGAGGAGGVGGNSGQGNGGTVTLNAEGGLIETGDLAIVVNGYGANGSQGGQGGNGIVPPGPVTTPPTPAAPNGAFGASGIGGGGVGGAVYITAQNDEGGSVGGLDLGAVSLDVTGLFDFGGFIATSVSGLVEISDTVDETNGGVRFASLDVTGFGDPVFNPVTLSITSIAAPIRIANSLSAGTGGTIDLTAIQTGGLEIGGQLDLSTDSSIRIVSSQGGLIHAADVLLSSAGTTLVSAQSCVVPLCPTVVADNLFRAFTGGDFALLGPARVEAGSNIAVHSGGNVTGEAGSGYRAPNTFITAENDVTIRNASGGSLDAEGGLVLGEGNFFVNGNLTLGEANGSGVFDLSGSLFGSAGTSIDVTARTSIKTANAIDLIAGDDVRIGAGASLTNTTSGSEPGFIRLDAGGLGAKVSYPAGNVASLLIGSGATIDGTGGSVTLSGGAIDGRGATFRGAGFSADVVNPPAAGVVQRNDNGQLTAPCLEGDICLGAITATGAVRIGQGNSAPVRFAGFGNISGRSVAITSRDTLTYGAAASPFTITSAGQISLISQAGDIALAGNALLSGATVALSATGSVTGTGSLRSTGDIGIDVGANIALASLVAGRQLTTVAGIGGALEPLYTLPGNLAITTFQTAAATAIRAGGSIVIGSATTGDNDLSLTAGTLVSLGADSNVANLSLRGRDVAFATVTANGNIVLTATNAITGTSAVAGGRLQASGSTLGATTLRSGGAMTLTTTGATTLGTATSGGNLSIASAALAFSGLTSTGSTAIDAASIAGGNIAAGTSLVARTTGALALGSATAGTTLALDAASLAATTLRSGGTMTLNSGGAARLGSASSGADLTIATGDLTFASLASTGTVRIDASTVNGGDIAAGTSLAVATQGAIKLGTAGAGGALTLGGATIEAATLRSGAAISLASTGAISLGTASVGTTFTANAGALQFAGITAAGDVVLTAATVAGGDVTSTAGAIRLTASGAATVGQLRAVTDAIARATTLTFAGITAGRDVTLDVTMLGGTTIAAGQDLTIRSVNDLTFGTIAAGRNLSLNASSGAITVNTDIDAGGTVSLAGDAILIKAVGPLTVAMVTADNGDIAITTDGLLRVTSAASRGDVTLTSTANSLILGSIVAGRALATPSALNPGGTSKGTPGPGAITLTAAQAVTMQDTVDALTTLAATAGTLIDQRSLAVGKTIAYRSADLTLGQTAALGQSNFTTGIALTNTGSAGALLGDVAGTTAGYRLDNAEFARIHSGGDLSLAAGSSLTVGTLSASAASGNGGVADGTIGATSTLALATSGDLAVGGALALGNAAGNTLRLTGGTLSLDAGAGSVRLIEGSGHGGTLAISTGELSALTSAARTAIVGMDGNAINLRLAQNDGVSDGRTLLEAGSIAISASGRVLIQNTALGQTFDARRGFVADSFAINTSGSTGESTTTSAGSPLIVINGTVAGQTGLTALRAVQVTGGFDVLSTVNGCRLFTATCGTPQFDPLRDLIEDEIGRGTNLDSGDAIGEGMLILIDRFEPLGFEAVIDEPVTGSGNDDFLVPEAGTGDQQCEDGDKTKCDKPPAG